MSERNSRHNIIEYVIDLLSSPKNVGTPEGQAEYDARLETAFEIRDFLDEIPGGLLIYSADGNEDILYANSALVRMFGCDDFRDFKAHVHGTFKGLVHPDDLEEVEKSIVEQIKDSQFDLDYVEYRIIRKDGAVRWVDDYGHYISGQNNNNIFYVFISDVTEKKQRALAERAELIAQKEAGEQTIKSLVEAYDRERKLINREHLRRLEVIEGLSVNYDTILHVDFDASTVFPYRQGNRVYRQFKGEKLARDLDWYIKDYVNNIVVPEDRERVGKLLDPKFMRKKLAENRTYYANYLGGVDGIIQNLQIRIVNVSPDKRVSQAVIGYRNIDEDIKHEREQLQALEIALTRAKQAEVVKNAFLSNMSHDLRTPLNAIFGYTQLARSKTNGNAQVEEYLDKIDSSSKQMLELVEKLLEISYTEAKELAVTETECDVCDIVRGAFDHMADAAARKNIMMTLDVKGIEHRDVFADALKLRRTLGYIIGNAIKYTKPGGCVTITAKEYVQPNKEFSIFKFAVADTGIGITQQTLEHIFEPFVRESNTTSSKVFGLGLGLAIAKNTMDTMGGNIEVQSEYGKGSTFTVSVGLRLNTSAADTPVATAQEIMSGLDHKRVLVVEDNEINLEIIAEILESYGLLVETAENGKIAVEKILAAPFDYYEFVLMDIQMPVMDGREATRTIRELKDDPRSEIPIIALSANAFESDKRQSIESGMNAHLNKPLDVDALMKALSVVLASHNKPN